MQLNFEKGADGSLGDLLRTTKGKCLFQDDAGHGQVCSPLCNARVHVFHAEKDQHRNLDLRETKDAGIGVFAKARHTQGDSRRSVQRRSALI